MYSEENVETKFSSKPKDFSYFNCPIGNHTIRKIHPPKPVAGLDNNLELCALEDLFNDVAPHNESDGGEFMLFDSLDKCIDKSYKDLHNVDKPKPFRSHNSRNLPKETRPSKRQKTTDLRPVTFVRLNVRRGKPKLVTLRALLDSGGSGTLISERFAKKLKRVKIEPSEWSTPAGTLTTNTMVKAKFLMPEFHDNRLLEWKIHVTPNMGAYDMIIGRDILEDLGIDVRFSTQSMEWDGVEIPFKDFESKELQMFHIQDSAAVEDSVDRVKGILDNDYHKATLEEVARMQSHLSEDDREALLSLLEKYEELFDGTLGRWTHEDYHLELREGVKPYHARAFPAPRVHYETLKKEVERLCEAGALKRVNHSEWAAPTFIIPKKDGKVRFVSDFRELNKRIKRMPYPVPNIQDMLLNLEGFQYATALDLNMGYYHVRLDPDSRKLCAIILPWGKFEHQRLPQGICNGPDIFQEKMMELFDGMEFVRAYIDDLLILTKGSYEEHLEKLEAVLMRIQEAGLKVNATKSFFARGELEYLGYWITRDGIKPMPKKIEAIQKISIPKNQRELRKFIGIVNYYRDMWIRRSHVLAPLAALTSKKTKWKWTDVHTECFEKAKRIISREVMLAYPDFSKPFEIHTDASHFQLGAVISQGGKPIAFYSRKLNDAQTRYTTTERELLSIVETLKEFRNILLGHKITVYTDHKNLVYKHFNTERVMRWRLVIEEFGPELKYIKGESNIVADALSRLGMMGNEEFASKYEGQMEELLAMEEEDFPKEYPLTYAQLQHEQERDVTLIDAFAKSSLYKKETYNHADKQYSLITRDGKIVVPKKLQKDLMEWYHTTCMHAGETRTELTINQHFYWTNMRKHIVDHVRKCPTCQLTKKKKLQYGQLPAKEAEVIPWHTLCIDLVGPYTIGPIKYKTVKGVRKEDKSQQTTLHALTMIDPATGWFEIVTVPNKRADEISNILEQVWLNRYPYPTQVVMDRGREFKAEVEAMLKNDYGITRKLITTRNPQANAIVERAHQTVGNMIRSCKIEKKSDLEPYGNWEGVLSAVGKGARSTVHTTLQATPTQLVFGRDAILNIGFEADWQYIKERKQKLILQNNKRENAKRVPHHYEVGNRVMVLQDPNRKFGENRCNEGLHSTADVCDNGTVKLQQDTPSGGVVYQTWNIRNVTPYRD